MSRRNTELFSLSMLDLLTGALGAIIFLFIITPKGEGAVPAVEQQAVVYFDTLQMKIHGTLPDSLLAKRSGDSLLVILKDYKNLPKNEKSPYKVLAKNEAQLPKPSIGKQATKVEQSKPKRVPNTKPTLPTKKSEVKKGTPKKEDSKSQKTTKESSKFKGSPPSVPAAVSFEINWPDKNDNVDLIVCKDGKCVYGGKKRIKNVGQWDSGKSRNRLFGNDLRTNQEAVRQYDEIIPGKYQIYAQFKESKKNNKTTIIKGLIYTKNAKLQERGEHFTRTLSISNNRFLIGTVQLKADGTYQFIKK
ncbi:MAG: hypothetical protein AB8F94_16535 [Saprospiraceae bacterium]